MPLKKRYIGDGVYVAFDDWYVILTTEDGVNILNTIFLEPEVVGAFLEYVNELRANHQPTPVHYKGDSE